MRRRTFVRQEEANLVSRHCEDRCAQHHVKIVLRGAVENEEEGDSNKVDECPQKDLRNVQANYRVTNSLFDMRRTSAIKDDRCSILK